MAQVTTEQIIAPQQIAATATQYYEVPAGAKTIVRRITFTNTHVTDVMQVTVYYVPSAGSANDATTLLKTYNIGPTQTRAPAELEQHTLIAGDTIWLEASTASEVTVVATGTKVVE